MTELLRVYTVRPPEALSQNDINTLGIHSHPETYQSNLFKDWLTLCRQNLKEELRISMFEFLKGAQSLKDLNGLGKEWAYVFNRFLALGNQLDKNEAYQIVKDSNVLKALNKEKHAYSSARTAVADTLLCLAYFKNLSYKGNIDYQFVLKSVNFVEDCLKYNFDLPQSTLSPYFERPVLLPSCFFNKLDPCDIKPVQDNNFPFLENHPSIRPYEVIPPAGCVDDGDCNCKQNEACIDQGTCCANIRLQVVDLMVVREELKCYKSGELSFIRNVLDGETLESTHRRLERTEEFVETEQIRSTFEERNLQTEEKSSLKQEIESVTKKDSAWDAGLTTNSSFGIPISGANLAFGTNSTTNLSGSESKSITNKDVRDYSREVLEKATKNIEERIKRLASTKRLFETEETNLHTFKNESGSNLSGQYLYVNKIIKTQVLNYGKKAALNIYLPEPSSLFKKLLENKFGGVKPVMPQRPAIDPKSITPENYKDIMLQYLLKDMPPPPDFLKDVVVRLEGEMGDPADGGSGSHIFNFPCTIPASYYSLEMFATIIRLNYNSGGGVSISATLGPYGHNVSDVKGGSQVLHSTLPPLEGNQNVVVHTWDVTQFTWLLRVRCALKDELKIQWQLLVYEKIIADYEKQLEKYETELEKYEKELKEFELKEAERKAGFYNRNPFVNREVERTELKRMVISYITCQFFDKFDAMKSRVKPCGYPEMDIREAEEEGKFIQFFEQAFNWNLMTYVFYPYFWGRKCTWKDKIREESNDLIFHKFLSAGSCRVLVPVRDGFYNYVQYFLSTGEIWGQSGIPPLPNDPQYVSMAQEIKEQKAHYFTEREGRIDAVNGQNVVTLNGTNHYWTFANSNANPPIVAGLNMLHINADIDREIILDCKVYKIVDIQLNSAISNFTSWFITIDRNYEGSSDPNANLNMKWSTGAVFIGAPWEVIVPTTLTFLREKSPCLPCYPLKECKDQ